MAGRRGTLALLVAALVSASLAGFAPAPAEAASAVPFAVKCLGDDSLLPGGSSQTTTSQTFMDLVGSLQSPPVPAPASATANLLVTPTVPASLADGASAPVSFDWSIVLPLDLVSMGIAVGITQIDVSNTSLPITTTGPATGGPFVFQPPDTSVPLSATPAPLHLGSVAGTVSATSALPGNKIQYRPGEFTTVFTFVGGFVGGMSIGLRCAAVSAPVATTTFTGAIGPAPTGAITGTVTKSGGVPVANVTVSADDATGAYVSTTTNASGAYVVSGLATGDYRVRFQPSAGSQLLGEYFDDHNDFFDADTVHVVNAAPTPGVNALLASAGTIGGTVRNGSNVGIGGVVVTVRGGEVCALTCTATTAANGTYQLDLPAGSYKVCFNAESVAYASECVGDTYGFDEAPATVVVSAQVATASPTLGPGGSLSGLVKLANGTPQPTPSVEIFHAGLPVFSGLGVVANPDGTYQDLSLKPGVYTVKFNAPYGQITEWYNNATSPASATSVPVVGGANTPNINAQFAALGVISGTVTRLGGLPVTDAEIAVSPVGGGSYPGSVTSDAAGAYQVVGLSAGAYRVHVTPPVGSDLVGEYFDDADDWANATTLTVADGVVETADVQLAVGAKISGTVTGPGAVAVSGATVTAAVNGSYGQAISATTDANGAYTVQGLVNGEYTVRFAPPVGSALLAEYYLDAMSPIVATPVSAAAGAPVIGIDAQLVTGASISGIVTSSAVPLAGAVVSVVQRSGMFSGPPLWSATTDALGQYSLEGLPPGSHTLRLAGPAGSGLIAEYYRDAPSASGAEPVTVDLGQAVTAINADLQAGATISGTVTKSGGSPVASVAVTIDGMVNPTPVTTNASGQYSVAGVTPGYHSVCFTPPYQSPLVRRCHDGAPDASTATLVYAAPGTLLNIDAQLPTGGTISGTVTAGGVAQANVGVSTFGTFGYFSAMTDVAGHYTISGLDTGSYYVGFNSFGYANNYYPDVTQYAAATMVTVQLGGAVAGIDAHLVSSVGSGIASISGTVTGPGATPVAGAWVSATLTAGGCCFGIVASTDAAGRYTLPYLSAGTYRVLAEAPPSANLASQYFNGASTAATATPVVAASGSATPGIDFHLTGGGSITGTVTSGGATPAEGVWVSAQNIADADDERFTVTNASGNYTVTGLRSASYRVHFGSSYTSDYVGEYYDDQADPAAANPVAVTAGNITGGIDADVIATGSVRGRVTGPTGTPVAGAAVLVRTPADEVVGYAYSDADGQYRISGLAPGSYEVSFLPPNGSNTLPESYMDKALDAGDPVVVAAGATTNSIDAQLAVGARVSGTVTGPNGAPLGGVAVEAWWTDVICPEMCIARTVTAFDGTYVISGLPAADVSVYFRPVAGIASQWYNGVGTRDAATAVTVTPGSLSPGVDAQLTWGGRVAGAVTLGAGAYLGGGRVEVRSIDGSQMVATGSLYAGTYVVTGVPAGTFRAVVLPSNSTLSPTIYVGASRYADGADVIVAEAQTTSGIDMALQASGSISGTVTKNGQPLGGAMARAYARPGFVASSGIGGFAQSDATGKYMITGVPIGDYQVAFGESYSGPSQWYDVSPTEAGAATVTVTAGAAVTGIDAYLGAVVPSAPGAPLAYTGNAEATVSWVPPTSDGGAPITGYTVTSTPEGKTCNTTGALVCRVTGLTNTTSYTFTVHATNGMGNSPESSPSSAVTPRPGSRFHAVTPFRAQDSRPGPGQIGFAGAVGQNASKDLTVAPLPTIPASATAVVMNVTVTAGTAGSYLTVYPTGASSPPTAANVLFAPGQTVPNQVTTAIGTGGKVSFYNQLGSVHVVGDVVGYYDDGSDVTGGLFEGLAPPTRLVDSRSGGNSSPTWNNAALGNDTSRNLAVRGNAGVPASATAVVMNVTVTGGTAASYLQAYPAGAPRPTTANVLFAPGQTVSNLVTVGIGSGGAVAVYNQQGSVHVVADVVGYFDPTSGSAFYPLSPVRLLDSRQVSGPWAGAKLGADANRSLDVSSLPGGGSAIPPNATGVVVNLTVTAGSAASFLTMSPSVGPAHPGTANLLFAAGQTIPNAVMVGVGTASRVDIYNQLGSVHVIVDTGGYFAPL